MPNWLFALVVLGFGIGIAVLLDRMRRRAKDSRAGGHRTEREKEKSRWLTFWYLGRFPTAEEQKEEELERKRQDRE